MGMIYGLFDPRTDELRYIGKTETLLEERLRMHLKPSCLEANTHKNFWVKMLQTLGQDPLIRTVQQVPSADLNGAEVYWIAHFRSVGCRLLNHTPGGDGNCRGTRFSEATRQKMSESQSQRREWERQQGIVRKMPPSALAKLSSRGRGVKASEATRAKISAERQTRYLTQEARDQHSAVMKASWAERLPRVQDDQGTIYPNALAASVALGVHRVRVCRVLKQGKGTVKGRTLRYLPRDLDPPAPTM